MAVLFVDIIHRYRKTAKDNSMIPNDTMLQWAKDVNNMISQIKAKETKTRTPVALFQKR